MTFLITGGAGFIGSNYIFYVINKYPMARILCVDNLVHSQGIEALAFASKNPQFRFVEADITNRKAMNLLFEEEHPEIVVNFAAENHVDRSIVHPEIFLQTNVIGTSVLMDACCKYGIKRFHQVSTDEVYGDLPLDRADLFFVEESQLSASSPYSASKAAADLLVLSYYRTYDLPVTISRCTNNYGPNQYADSFIPLLIKNALEDKPMPVYGHGLNIRDWIYVTDHCRAIDLILRNGRNGQIYNVGANQEMRNIDVAKMICRELGKPESLITFVEDRKGHDLRYAVDATKIQQELGWAATVGFEEGLKKLVKSYKEKK